MTALTGTWIGWLVTLVISVPYRSRRELRGSFETSSGGISASKILTYAGGYPCEGKYFARFTTTTEEREKHRRKQGSSSVGGWIQSQILVKDCLQRSHVVSITKMLTETWLTFHAQRVGDANHLARDRSACVHGYSLRPGTDIRSSIGRVVIHT